MRRPGEIDIGTFVTALERQLRDEMRRLERRSLPRAFHRLARILRSVLKPVLQSGAMVLTSLAVIVAVGVAPATTTPPQPVDAPLAAPSPQHVLVTSDQLLDRLPPEEFLVATAPTADQLADIPDRWWIELE
jgi:hypothetical protein